MASAATEQTQQQQLQQQQQQPLDGADAPAAGEHAADGDDGGVGNGGGEDHDGDEEFDGCEADEDDLRRAWHSHCGAVRLLERSGSQVPSSLIEAARAQRDKAERNWRAARTPQPLHKRLRWAEAAVKEAEGKENRRRKELDDHLEASARRTRELEERLAIDAARTERKRRALQALLGKEALSACPRTEQAARCAITGIVTDIGPALFAAMGKLGGDAKEVHNELQEIALSLGRMEGMLREASDDAHAGRAPQTFDISGEAAAGRAAGAGQERAPTRGPAAGGAPVPMEGTQCAGAPRWRLTDSGGQWKRVSSAAAAAEARRMVQRRIGDGAEATDGDGGQVPRPEDTNDLHEAERRARDLAAQQVQQAIQQQEQQHLRDDPQGRAAEDQRRGDRERRQQEEMQRHQQAIETAAAAAAAEEERQRRELLDNMSPEQRAQVEALRTQQLAVGSQVFGTAQASQLAGLVHQEHVRRVAVEREAAAEVDRLMEMSPEEFAAWDREQQSLL
jgi:hypothetical protein